MPDRIDANLLRQHADGELADDQAAALLQQLEAGGSLAAEARERLAAERTLRRHVCKAMQGVAAPAALRESIIAATRTQGATDAALDGEPVELAGRIGPRTPMSHPSHAHRHRSRHTLRRLFASPHRANVLAVAAVLALIAGAVLFGIFGRTIDDVPPPSPADLVADAAEYVDAEHGDCIANLERLQRKVTHHTADETERALGMLLGAPVHVFDLAANGYEFIGGGECKLPLGRVPSGHLIYRKIGPEGRSMPMVSVFMAPAQRGSCSDICKRMKPCEWLKASGGASRHRVLYSTDRRMVYFLVCCDEQDLDPVALTIAQEASSRQ